MSSGRKSARTRILITGGAGFIGSHLAAAGLKAGLDVHVALRPRTDPFRLEHLGARVRAHVFDLHDAGELRRCLEAVHPEIIFHLAASPRRPPHPQLKDVRDFVEEDLDALLLLLREAGSVRKPPAALIRAGSLAEYGAGPAPYREKQREAPMSAYAAGLVAATHLVEAIQPRLPFPVVTARLALVYGPGQSTDYLIPLLVSRCLAGQETVVQRPADRRDLLFVDDVTAALLRMASRPDLRAGVVNVASGLAPSMADVACMIVELTGADPRSVRYGRGDAAVTGPTYLCGSPALARALLDWHAATPLPDGLARTVQWWREAGTPAAVPHPLLSCNAQRFASIGA